ncbi:DUF6089 family protein [Persicobacter diffluens]|uniref:type IX secretion system protein PorG n=1 Tax=Persicobacter diffluens TaxID=981 RepID=UPI0030C6B9BD
MRFLIIKKRVVFLPKRKTYLCCKLTLLLGFMLVWKQEANAQFQEIGVGIGGMTYTGDIQPNFSFKETLPAVAVAYRRNYQYGFTMRYQLLVGSIQGSDANTARDNFATSRNASFNALMTEASAVMEYNFMDYKSSGSGYPWTPYLFLGVGFNYFQGTSSIAPIPPENSGVANIPATKYNYNSFSYTATITGGDSFIEQKNAFPLVIPLGFGFKYSLNPNWTLNLEFGARLTFTDRLDNVSQEIETSNHSQRYYPSEPEEVKKRDFYYGHDSNADMYYYFGLSLSYGFFSVPCPHDFY